MLLVPDPDTAYMDPFTKHATININCFVKDPVTGEMYSRDPRGIAKKAELYLKQSGIADTSYWGPEAEFFVFDGVRYSSGTNEAFYSIDSEEAWWESGRSDRPNYGGQISPKRTMRPARLGVMSVVKILMLAWPSCMASASWPKWAVGTSPISMRWKP